ncbi:SDR family oxidoreductase [Terriglobus aquaticus]|uniref:SDR family oxidoreductase n=1 Tax=Terriglobus aquaticus TaxID=940139 RepID=A0ABW9KGB2_9BACT|nr:SDR family oxidoreductase [Terriglobus aquaticus]
MDGRTIVITGASTGIGYSIAERFAKAGWQVFGSVRKAADGDRLQRELGVTPLHFDVTDGPAIAAAAAEVAAALGNRTLDGLINNAGLVVSGPMLYLKPEEMLYQQEVNVLGPMRVTQAFAPLLGVDRTRQGRPGRISQISSVAGSNGFPFMGAYCASKHALNGMSESLRRELLMFGIEVSIVAPGAIVTPIWDKGEQQDMEQYRNTPYGAGLPRFREEMLKMGRRGLPASRVTDAVWHAMTASKPKLRYEVIPNKFREYTLPRLLPKRMVDRFFGKMLGPAAQG